MVDHVKKVQAFEGLDAGEQVRAAIFLQPHGNLAQMGAMGGVGGLVGAGIGSFMKKRKQKQAAEEIAESGATTEGMAQTLQIPGGGGYLVVTDRRWLVLEQHPIKGKPKAVVAAPAFGDIAAATLSKGKVMGKAVVRCTDSSALTYDLPRGNDLESFAQAAQSTGCTVTID